MNKLMILALTGLMFVVGCQTVSSGFKPTDQQLVQDENDVKTSARIATRVYILTVDDPSERAKTSAFANQVAKEVLVAVNNKQLSIDQLRVYANELINNSHIKHKEAVGLLLDSVAVVVEERINQDLVNLTGDQKNAAALNLIKAAAEGVVEATNTATTQP